MTDKLIKYKNIHNPLQILKSDITTKSPRHKG